MIYQAFSHTGPLTGLPVGSPGSPALLDRSRSTRLLCWSLRANAQRWYPPKRRRPKAGGGQSQGLMTHLCGC